jgi:hypothetical protein
MMQFHSKPQVYGPIIITPSPLLSAEVGFAYSATLIGTGGTPPYIWTQVSGSLPPGIAMNAAGIISGTPTGQGLFLFVAQITDAAGISSVPAMFSLSSVAQLVIRTANPLPAGTQGTPYSATLSAAGGVTPYSLWALTSGLLDAGLVFNTATGTISGTPANAETDTLTFQIIDALGYPASKTFSLTVNPTGGWSLFNPAYPRNGSARITSSVGHPIYNTAFLNWAKTNQIFVTMGGNYVGSQPGTWPTTKDAYVQSLLAAGIPIVLQYFDPSIYNPSDPDSIRPNWNSHINNNNWELYLSGISGTKASYIGNTATALNPNWSEFVPNDTSGVAGSSTDKHGNFAAKWWKGQYYDGLGPYASPSPSQYCSASLSGMYADDQWGMYWPFATPADIQRAGTAAQFTSANYTGAIGQSWRQGGVRMVNQILADIPGAFVFCNQNYVDRANAYGLSFTDPTQHKPINGVYHGMQLQRYLGGSVEQFYPFANVMGGYQLLMALCKAPQLCMVDIAYLNADGSGPLTWNANGTPATNTAPYVFMRYCTAFILMGTGFQSHDGFTQYTDQNLLNFDEWGGNTAQYPKGFMGLPVGGAIQTTAKYGNGIWEQRFFNASTGQFYRAVMNPRGNGAQTYNPGVTLFKMRGPQNPIYNNANSFTTLAMASPDGGIFCESAQ